MYRTLSKDIEERIRLDRLSGRHSRFAFPDSGAVRRDSDHDRPDTMRTPFIRDAEKILHSPFYNRYADKTQVFSLYRNDDLTRRSLHVQIVSRTARTMGETLGLNTNLIEAIALGHDIGHTPFGHAGEKFLSDLTYSHMGRYFCHNIQSVRVLDKIFHHNLSLMTLNGIAAHNGEVEAQNYAPLPMTDFEEFDRNVEACCLDEKKNLTWVPSTLEGCLVRICDMIAYLGKDRQDAIRIGLVPDESVFSDTDIGRFNAEMMNNLTVDIIENSYGKNAISMSPDVYRALAVAKRENYEIIYLNSAVKSVFDREICPMMERLYETLRQDCLSLSQDSLIYRHHISKVEMSPVNRYADHTYREESCDAIVADYIASMTDDYFIDLYRYLFPSKSPKARFVEYFKQ